jgi:hypothetical protein
MATDRQPDSTFSSLEAWLAPYGTPFTKVSVVVGRETDTSLPIAWVTWKFLSLKMTVGVTSCPFDTSKVPEKVRISSWMIIPGN